MEETEDKGPAPGRHSGIYGWRKRCLYLVLLLLLLVVTVNITLVLWIIKVLQFNTNGLSYMQMVGSGVQFTGKNIIQDTLVASVFFTRTGEAVSIHSAKNLTMRTTDHVGHTASNIYLGDDKLEINTPSFKVTDPRGKTMFSVDKDTVSLTTSSLAISGEGGARLEGSVQTPIVSAGIRSDLVLESVKKSVQAVTPAGVSIESRAGDILAISNQDITLVTVDGSIKLESSNVLIPNLNYPQSGHHLRKHHHMTERIYQLCICNNGDLYLGESETFCDSEMCQT